MRLTTARYYTPSGRSIQAKGIEPDIEVQVAKIEEIAVKRLREGDLKGALDKDNGKEVKKPDAKAPPAAANDNADPEDPDASAEDKDYQLLRAIDLLRGVSMYGNRFQADVNSGGNQ